MAFARLERDHGEPLVRRALGYITASRKGVTMNELEDLISLDDLVMEELTLQYKVRQSLSNNQGRCLFFVPDGNSIKCTTLRVHRTLPL